MATTADIITRNSDGSLHIVHEGFSTTLTKDGKSAYGKGSKDAAEAVFEYIKDHGKDIDSKLKGSLADVAKQLEVLGLKPEKVKALESALNFQASATVEETTSSLIRNPIARGLLSDKEIEKFGISSVTKLDGMIASKEKLVELAKDTKGNKEAIRAILVEQIGENKTVSDAILGNSKGKVSGVLSELEREFKAASTKIEGYAAKIAQYDTNIEAAAKAGKSIEGLEKGRAGLVQKVIDTTEGKDFGSKLFEGMKDTDPKLYDALKDADKGLATHIDSAIKTGTTAAKTVAKDGSWFTKGATELKGVATEKKVAIEKLGMWAKRTGKGKAALVGVPVAVVAAYVAATGNRGPAEHSQTVGASKSQEPVAGRA